MRRGSSTSLRARAGPTSSSPECTVCLQKKHRGGGGVSFSTTCTLCSFFLAKIPANMGPKTHACCYQTECIIDATTPQNESQGKPKQSCFPIKQFDQELSPPKEWFPTDIVLARRLPDFYGHWVSSLAVARNKLGTLPARMPPNLYN